MPINVNCEFERKKKKKNSPLHRPQEDECGEYVFPESRGTCPDKAKSALLV